MNLGHVLLDISAADPETASDFREDVVPDWIPAVLDAQRRRRQAVTDT